MPGKVRATARWVLVVVAGLLWWGGTGKAGQRIVIGCDVCPEAVIVPGGTHLGEVPDAAGDAPRGPATIQTFAAGVWEVTVGEFTAYLEATGRNGLARVCAGQEERGRAVACVSWEEAVEYLAWLSERTGAKYRLLSDAEWGYVAARASELGVFEVRGGVAEWVEDCWRPNVGDREDERCGRHVVRGGSWLNGAPDGWFGRYGAASRLRQVDVGFRIARSLEDE